MSNSHPTNSVLEQAPKKHIGQRLEAGKKFKLLEPPSTPGDIFKEVEKLTREYQDKPMGRYIARFAKVIEVFQNYFSVVDAFVSSDPLVAGLIWGGFRFIIQVCFHCLSTPTHELNSSAQLIRLCATFQPILRRS
jgi:hypothetical protein